MARWPHTPSSASTWTTGTGEGLRNLEGRPRLWEGGARPRDSAREGRGQDPVREGLGLGSHGQE